MKTYVVIGSSIAGLNGIDVLRQLDKDAEIVLVSEETEIYSKCVMHFYMNGSRSKDMLNFVDETFMDRNRVIWKKGMKAVRIDTEKKEVYLSDDTILSYDKLLLATGSHAFVPSIEGAVDAKNVLPFHSLNDCEIIMDLAKKASDIVILGAGLVGVDVANGLVGCGKNITLLDMKEHMLSVQLDAKAASVYEEEFCKRGIDQLYGVSVTEIVKNAAGEVEFLILSDGKRISCDLLIIASGTRANVELAEASCLVTDKYGLDIDGNCQTSADDVYGAGDVTGRNMVWPVAAKEAMVAAYNMVGIKREMTDFFSGKSTINLFDIPTMAYGMPDPPDDTYTVEIKEDTDGSYQKLIHKDGKIYGVILQRNLYYSGILNQLIAMKPNLTKVKKPLFELDYADMLLLEPTVTASVTGKE